ncbi:hypothetical protein ACHHYP_20820 [Achlya hypogyna]|uniref:Uncharacterized protein n=1 Tax=Achlya hypogyna TaxID=1202772 RepID=A0A1V9Y6I0_ACHHY|nr:hypothetical protein ACHHYP_20820 [Achlya hypogyna]
MESGVMDVLTVIPPEEILEKGIAYVFSSQKIMGWFKVRVYRKDSWLKHDFDLELLNCKNNSLEKYNLDFGDMFLPAHHCLLSLIQLTKEVAKNYVARLIKLH